METNLFCLYQLKEKSYLVWDMQFSFLLWKISITEHNYPDIYPRMYFSSNEKDSFKEMTWASFFGFKLSDLNWNWNLLHRTAYFWKFTELSCSSIFLWQWGTMHMLVVKQLVPDIPRTKEDLSFPLSFYLICEAPCYYRNNNLTTIKFIM